MNVAEVGTLVNLAAQVDMNPVRLGARSLGLSKAESDAGPSFWAVMTASVLVGVTAGVLIAPLLRKR